ncbi:hypothetical protein SSX86_014390 [Deinandra increscens subsp. villosa]|uniref:TF-B3 domain-containing protein n=1 Tax=Deinandra increscens subsp. villosa TaxID=3103831 RepID=A0AAP0GZC3_9ASTR
MATAASPVNTERTSDLQLAVIEPKTPNSPQTVTIAQFPPAKASFPAPLTPSPELSDKRIKLKPDRYGSSLIKAVKRRLPKKDKAVKDPLRKSLSLGRGRPPKDSNTPVQITQTMIRARDMQSTLGNEHPSFLKTMLKSHVTCCFWLGLPLPFCRSFLPKQDSMMVTEDENGEQCDLKFIAHKFGLSAGWRKFAIGHKLHEGDVLIFQLVESCKFKVYITRRDSSKEVNEAVNVKNHDAQTEHVIPGTKRSTWSSISLPSTKVKRKYKRSKPTTQPGSCPMDHSVVNSQVQGGSPEPNLSLKDVKTFKDFHIMVNGQCIDSELSEEIRMKYYRLCIGKNEILHDAVREGLFYKLVAGMIGETVNIAGMIKNCKITTRKEELDIWDSSLKSFELIGMQVGFLRDRIRALVNLAFESEDAKRYGEAKDERNRNTKDIKILEAKLAELYESNRKIDGVVDGLKEKAERCGIEFQKKVDEPW